MPAPSIVVRPRGLPSAGRGRLRRGCGRHSCRASAGQQRSRAATLTARSERVSSYQVGRRSDVALRATFPKVAQHTSVACGKWGARSIAAPFGPALAIRGNCRQARLVGEGTRMRSVPPATVWHSELPICGRATARSPFHIGRPAYRAGPARVSELIRYGRGTCASRKGIGPVELAY